jgi:hypothetical protein
MKCTYRRWLGFLKANYPGDLSLAPAERITPERVRAFIDRLSVEVRPSTVAIAGARLCAAARLIAPTFDWAWLRSVKSRLEGAPYSSSSSSGVTCSTIGALSSTYLLFVIPKARIGHPPPPPPSMRGKSFSMWVVEDPYLLPTFLPSDLKISCSFVERVTMMPASMTRSSNRSIELKSWPFWVWVTDPVILDELTTAAFIQQGCTPAGQLPNETKRPVWGSRADPVTPYDG